MAPIRRRGRRRRAARAARPPAAGPGLHRPRRDRSRSRRHGGDPRAAAGRRRAGRPRAVEGAPPRPVPAGRRRQPDLRRGLVAGRLGTRATRADSLRDDELRRLHRQLRGTIALLLRRGGSHTGELMVARRRGGLCPKDGAPLSRTVVGGRTTYWCPEPGATSLGRAVPVSPSPGPLPTNLLGVAVRPHVVPAHATTPLSSRRKVERSRPPSSSRTWSSHPRPDQPP